MTSSDAPPLDRAPTNMELEALTLSAYLDILPQPAIIFTFGALPITANSLEVCYVNRSVWNTIGQPASTTNEDLIEEADTEAHFISQEFKTLLTAQLIHPSTNHFVQWLNEVAQQSKLIYRLKTRFKGYSVPKDLSTSEYATQFVDIDWKAVFLKEKYIILTGKRTGTIKFSSHAPSGESTPDIISKLPPAIDEEDEEIDSKSSHFTSKSGSSDSSTGSTGVRSRRRKAAKRALSSATTKGGRSHGASSSLAEGDEGSETEVDPWRNDAKVPNLLRYI